MDGLLIREPWISRILCGRKTWEMRSKSCGKRGQIALIRAGSGLVVGVADIVDSLASLDTLEAYAAAEPFHAIGPNEQKPAYEGGWRTPWVLSNARSIPAPVPYRHPSGAVTWVVLDPSVAQAIASQIGAKTMPPTAPAKVSQSTGAGRVNTPVTPEPPELARPTPVLAESRIVRLTGGNIRNGHMYVPLDFFPADAVGGANKQEAAPRALRVSFVPGETTQTDVDGTKRILRARGPVRDFLARCQLREGDAVLIERTTPYSYRISKA